MKCWCDTQTAIRAASSQRPSLTYASKARSRVAMPSATSPRNHSAWPSPSSTSPDGPDCRAVSNAARAVVQSASSIARCASRRALARLVHTGEYRNALRLQQPQPRVPTAIRYSFSNSAASDVPLFHLSQNASSAASNSSARPFLSAFARAAIVGP